MSELGEACEAWQSGQAESSLLRGAARVLSGIPHYFDATFITKYENDARADQRALDRAGILLRAVHESDPLTAAQWRERCSLPIGDFAGRGLAPKPQDPQILAVLEGGEITMPLWGVSLDAAVAESFGTRFLFALEGPFHGITAWTHSGNQEAQLEIITGGCYRVERPLRTQGETTHATLREIGTISPP